MPDENVDILDQNAADEYELEPERIDDDPIGLIPAIADRCLTKLREGGQLFTSDGHLVDIVNGEKIRVLSSPSALKFYLRRAEPGLSEKHYVPVAADILSNPEKTAGFPEIERIANQPTFRPDFTMVPEGYDASTRLYYKPSAEVKFHVFNPGATKRDAEDALARLQYLFADFPFNDEASRTNTIATLITLVIRHAIGGVVPAWACNGLNEFSQNVGKGKIFKALISIAFGRDVKTSTVPPTPTQMLQTLSAEIRNGAAYVVFDDIKSGRMLESNDLNAFLTADSWNCKVPSTIISYQLPVRLVVLFNGNNLKMSVDLTNRMCWSDLFHEETQKRNVNDFRIYKDHGMEFDDYLQENRLQLLDAVVTLVLAWKNAGMPKRKASSPLVKYAPWERTVGGILEFAGAKDFLANQKAKSEAADDKTADIVLFIDKLIEVFPRIEECRELLQDIAELMMDGGPLAEVLPDMPRGERGFSIKLGRYIKGLSGRVFGNHKIVSEVGSRNKSMVWCPKVGTDPS
jgi:hypothetical protein